MMKELLNQITLLYVEDDDTIRPVLQRALERRVKNLYVAKDGQEGYEKFLEFHPDIILTDIKMPRLNGIEMSKMIKDIKPDVPIIMVSAHSEAGFFLECIELGIDAYLLKPIDKTKLLNMLSSNAKVVLFEREKEKQQKLLQAVIDLQPSIIFSYDETRSTLFVNKLFLDFFQHNSDETIEHIYEELKEKNNVKIVDVNEEIFWIDYLFLHPNEVFKIKVTKKEVDIEFLVKTKEIINQHESEKVIVITLAQLQ